MTGLVRKAMLFGVCGLLAAATALANVPNPGNSPVPKYVLVVDTWGSAPIGPNPNGTFTYTVRDFSNNAIANCRVELDFSACCDLRLANATVIVAGQTLKQCQPPIVSAVTNSFGQVTFTIVGGGENRGTCAPGTIVPGAGVGCVSFSACGYPMGNATAVILNEDGAATGSFVSGGDQSALIADQGAIQGFHAGYRGRSDFSRGSQTLDPIIDGADFSAFIPLQGASASHSSVPFTAACTPVGLTCNGGVNCIFP